MTLDGGVPQTRGEVLTAAGDVLVIAGLVVVGQVNHGTDPIETPVYSLLGIAPFVLGWLVAAPLTGLYRDPDQPRIDLVRLVTVTWLGAANIGLVLRTAPVIPGGVTWPFGVVITGFGLLTLLGFRLTLSIMTD